MIANLPTHSAATAATLHSPSKEKDSPAHWVGSQGGFLLINKHITAKCSKQNTDFLDKPPRDLWESKLLFSSSTLNLLEA